jgi:hypothetical protein
VIGDTRQMKNPLLFALLLTSGSFLRAETPTPAERNALLGWWREARFGMFVHRGVYDGFAMYDSQVSEYNIGKATLFARDPVKELQAACRKQGMQFGFYYSHAFDWDEENGPGNYEIRVTAKEITGEEPMRLRSILLTPKGTP